MVLVSMENLEKLQQHARQAANSDRLVDSSAKQNTGEFEENMDKIV